jgi:hypothetical protein
MNIFFMFFFLQILEVSKKILCGKMSCTTYCMSHFSPLEESFRLQNYSIELAGFFVNMGELDLPYPVFCTAVLFSIYGSDY